MVLICLLKLRCYSKTYNSTFYTILLQHCIADIIIMIFYTLTWGLRTKLEIRELLFKYQEYYVAAALYNSIYYTLYIRCTGIIFLSVHRFLVISSPTHCLTIAIQDASAWKIVMFYWVIPTLISVIVLKDTNVHYNSMEDLEYVVPKTILSRNTFMALITLSSTCLICIICYVFLWIIIRMHKTGSPNISRSLQREFYLAFQVLALLCAFFIMLTYYALVNYFSRTENTGPIFYMRAVYPIANGFLSYINPYCVLLLNRDFSKQFRSMFKCRKNKNSGPVYTMRALYPIANGILSYINPFCILILNRDFYRQFMRTFKCEGIPVSEVRVSTVTIQPFMHRNSRSSGL
uniref:G_PROTEIN_RECEP_F1_2 domain-containing protein n=1 Tax=Caenorhabditis tropicalis TaxID=1561998 RepID=A0A1I7SYR3_9PELO